MTKRSKLYRILSFFFLFIIGTTLYIQSQPVHKITVKKEKTEQSDQDTHVLEFSSGDEIILPSSVVSPNIKKHIILEVQEFPSVHSFEIVEHSSTALTTFFVKLFNHTIATKAP